MIVKVQRPLFTTDTVPKALVYDKARTVQGYVLLTPEVEALFPDGSYKKYFQAQIDKRGMVTLGEEVEEQSW